MSITLAKQYIDAIDEVYKQASLTSVLDGDSEMVRAGANAGEIVIPKISMQGLGDYSRSSGYVAGDVSLTYETVSADYERGRKFTVDVMDDEETQNVAFGKLAGEFVRTKVVPEVDAYRISKIAGTSNIGSESGTLSSGADVVSALRTASATMDEAEVPYDGRILFITPTLFGLVEDLDTTKSREVLNAFSQVVKVPQSRMYTAIDLLDGTTSGETDGGYEKASGGKDINFLVVEKSAMVQFHKHIANDPIAPENNPDADGYLYKYRITSVCEVYENKLAGVYCHHKA